MIHGKQMPRKLAQVTLWLLLPILGACSSSGGDFGDVDTDNIPPPPTVEMGVFIDSPVQGLTAQSGQSTPGTTDANGNFNYITGSQLSFSVGAVQLGSLPDGKALVTPYDFGAAAENIARFLQTLDGDGNHLNGIDLTAAAAALADTALEASTFTLDATAFEAAIQPALDAALGPGSILIDAATAMANLDAALDTTFEVAELAGKVLIIDLPSVEDIGLAVFDPLADPADLGSGVTMLMRSDTLADGGDGTTTVLGWSVDANGILSITDPEDSSVITVEKVGGSMGIISLKLTQGAEELVGSFLSPANGVEMDLTGEDGRSFLVMNPEETAYVTFFPEGRLSRVVDELVFIDDWSLDSSGSLVTVSDMAGQISLTVLRNGSLAVGGDTLTFYATNLSGIPTEPDYQLDAMVEGTLTPVSYPDPSTAVRYDFTTSATAYGSSDPNLEAVFVGATVTGSFSYANWIPPIAVLDGPGIPGGAVYAGTVLDLTGSVAGMTFAEDVGPSVVGNDRFQPDNVDFLSVATGYQLITGFETTGYTLVNVRLFWIEASTTPDDFLQSDLLPDVLPAGLVGRLALDFEQTDDPAVRASVFFEDMTVSPSP